MSDYAHFLPKAVTIAQMAAEIANSFFRKAILIETKDDMSPVTVADKRAEEKVRKELSKAFPDHGILGEEFGMEGADKDFVWTIDPIDGTRSFIRGIPLFGTLLGLMHRKRVVLGVMVLPALGETYTAVDGKGAECNGKKIQVSAAKTIENAVVGCGDAYAFEQAGRTEYLSQLMRRAELVRGYTDCFGHSLVIRGALDAMVDPIVSPWDVVPIACLVKEAGGVHFGFDGTLSLENQSFISCTPALQRSLMEL